MNATTQMDEEPLTNNATNAHREPPSLSGGWRAVSMACHVSTSIEPELDDEVIELEVAR